VTDWIQAISAAAIAGLTFATLIVLRRYANDTQKLAQDTQSLAKETQRLANDSAIQVDHSQMPFLTVSRQNDRGEVFLENHGSGPAINIAHFQYEGEAKLNPLFFPSLGVGGRQNVNTGSFFTEYESLTGHRFETIGIWHAGKMKIRFRKLSS
jgi:hypothetical protein